MRVDDVAREDVVVWAIDLVPVQREISNSVSPSLSSRGHDILGGLQLVPRRNVELVHHMISGKDVVVTATEVAVVDARAFAYRRKHDINHVELARHQRYGREQRCMVALPHAIKHFLG